MKSPADLLRPLQEKLSPRERRALGLGWASVLIVATWAFLIAPAWRQITSAPAQRQTQDQILQTMQAQANEALQLKADTAWVERNPAKALQEATRLHLGAGSQIQLTGEKATVTVVATPATGLAQWLSTVRQNAHAKPTEARLTKAGTQWAGTVVLALPVKDSTP